MAVYEGREPPLKIRGTHNRQKETRTSLRKSKKRKGLVEFITPVAIYYLIVKPIIDIAIAIITAGLSGTIF